MLARISSYTIASKHPFTPTPISTWLRGIGAGASLAPDSPKSTRAKLLLITNSILAPSLAPPLSLYMRAYIPTFHPAASNKIFLSSSAVMFRRRDVSRSFFHKTLKIINKNNGQFIGCLYRQKKKSPRFVRNGAQKILKS